VSGKSIIVNLKSYYTDATILKIIFYQLLEYFEKTVFNRVCLGRRDVSKECLCFGQNRLDMFDLTYLTESRESALEVSQDGAI